MNDRMKNAWNLIFTSTLFQFPPFHLIAKKFYAEVFGFKNVIINRNVRIINLHKNPKAKIIIKPHTTIDEDVIIDYSGSVKIGQHVSIAPGTKIFTHNHEFEKNKPWAKITYSSLEIKDNAWIGANVVVLPRVKLIGECAIIGAGAIVTKDVKDFTVVAGNPARKIKVIGAKKR